MPLQRTIRKASAVHFMNFPGVLHTILNHGFPICMSARLFYVSVISDGFSYSKIWLQMGVGAVILFNAWC